MRFFVRKSTYNVGSRSSLSDFEKQLFQNYDMKESFMKKLSTEITTKKGERKIITVDVDDMYADWLITQPNEIYHI